MSSLCITAALGFIIALFFGSDALSLIQFGEKIHLPGDLCAAPGTAGAASPYRLVALRAAPAIEGFGGPEDGYPVFGGPGRALVPEALGLRFCRPAGGFPDGTAEASLGCAAVDCTCTAPSRV